MVTVEYSKDNVKLAYTALFSYITSSNSGNKPLLLVPIADGALMIFNGICRLLDHVGIDYDYQTIAFKKFNHSLKPEIEKSFRGLWPDHFVVLIDDIHDRGLTAQYAVAHLLESRFKIDSAYMRAVFLINRQFGGATHFNIDDVQCYSVFGVTHNKWFVGCGMDDNLKCRGACEIWTVRKPKM